MQEHKVIHNTKQPAEIFRLGTSIKTGSLVFKYMYIYINIYTLVVL